jgi:predicted dehydrogenase
MKVLLIGYGSIGRRHCRVLQEDYPQCRIDLVSKQQIEDHLVYPSLAEVEQLPSYDYFVICSETQLHYEQLDFLNRRVCGKNILVEKALFHKCLPPPALNNAIYVGYNMRYEPALQYLKRELSGQKVIFAGAYVGQYLPHWHPWADYRTSYSALKSKGGGVLLDLSHELDYLQWLTGELTEVTAFNARVSALEIETDDIVSGVARSREGAIVNFTMDYISKVAKRHLVLHTEEFSYFCDFIKNEVATGDKSGRQSVRSFGEVPHDQTYREMHRAVLDTGGGDVCTLEQGVQILSLCSAIRNSRVEGAAHV